MEDRDDAQGLTEAQPTQIVPTGPSRPAGRGSVVSEVERQKIREMSVFAELSVSEIARQTGRTRETIAKIVKDAQTLAMVEEANRESSEQALRLLHRAKVDAAKGWVDSIPRAVKRGDAKPMRDLLLHTNVIQPVDRGGSGQVIVNVGIIGAADVRIGEG